ncbi:MAG: hypothetical protein AAFR75_00900 [Pseudomonadota bacterium]
MGWFFKVMCQWCIIALLVSLPFKFPSWWPWFSIFCWTLAFGLVTYGIFNPKYAIRRVLLWGCGTVIASAVAPSSLQPAIRSYLVSKDTPDGLLAFYDVLSAIFFDVSLSPWVYVVLLTLAALEFVRMKKDENSWFGSNTGAHISQSGQNGVIARQPQNSDLFVLKAKFNITNSEDYPVQITESRFSIFFVNSYGEMYATGRVDEVSGEHPFTIPPKTSQEFSLTARNLPTLLSAVVKLSYKSRLRYLLDVTGYVQAFGNNGLSDKKQRLVFVFT